MRSLLIFAVIVACGCGSFAEPAGALASGRQEYATAAMSGPPLLVPTIAYVVTPGVTTSDRPVFVREPGAVARQIDEAIRVVGVHPNVLLALPLNGKVRSYRVGADVSLLYERQSRTGLANAIVVGGSVLQYDGTEPLILTSPTGETRSLNIPRALPTQVGPCRLQKMGRIDLRASSLWAVASVADRPYAYVASLGNGAVVDLLDGRRLDLPDAGLAVAMTAAADGKLYALTLDQRCDTNHLFVRRIDASAMREEATIDLGAWRPVVRWGLVAAAGGDVFVHEITDGGATLTRIHGSTVSSTQLPADSGLLEAAAPDGTIYLFGGRARHVVSRYDPRADAVTSVDDARAPDGSFVQAVFFPD